MRATRLPDRDAIAGCLLAALGAHIAWQASSWEVLGEEGPGPGFFPLGYGLLMIALSAVLVLRGALAAPAREEAAGGLAAHARALITWCGFAAAAIAMQWIGFVAAFALLSAFVAMFVFRRGAGAAAATGIGCAAGFWLVFQALMGVALPAGPWGF